MHFSQRLDTAILSLFPAWGMRRIASRRRLELLEESARQAKAQLSRNWEAADTDRFRGAGWITQRLSINSQIEENLEETRERAEDLYHHDCYAASAINGRVDNVVGCGIKYQSRIMPVDAGISQEIADALNHEIEVKWRRWAKIERLTAKQRQAERAKALYGESFVVMSDRGQADKPVPLSIEVINPKRVETPPGKEGDPNIRLGIRFAPKTRIPVAYFIRRSEPDDTKEISLQYDEIPAARVCHDFEEQFPGQIRGIPWLKPAMPLLKDLKDFAEANLISEQIAACFSVFIQKKTDPFGAAIAAATETTANGKRLEEISPGTIQYLQPDEEIQFSDPSRPGGTLEPFMVWRLRGVSGALRYPFELLIKAYNNSYSGGRLSLIDGRITFKTWQSQSIENTWEKVACRFTDECVILGEVAIDPAAYQAEPWRFKKPAFVPPGWPWISPGEEVSATNEAVEGGIGTRQESLAGRGLDWEETQEQRLREKLSDLEMEAAVEHRRQELAAELGDENFGKDAEQIKAETPAREPAEAAR